MGLLAGDIPAIRARRILFLLLVDDKKQSELDRGRQFIALKGAKHLFITKCKEAPLK